MPSSDPDHLLEALNRNLSPLSHLRLHKEWIQLWPAKDMIRGGYGDVDRGTLIHPDWSAGTYKHVAVKRLRPAGDYKQRLRLCVALARELTVWAGLNHPNIAQLFGYHIDDESDEDGSAEAWLISLWEVFGNVVEYLANNKVDAKTRLALAADTADGVTYLHRQKVCHGDLKGLNVLINRERRAVICDLGVARVKDSEPTGLSSSSGPKGTTRYLAPELLEGDKPEKTFASDIWAGGCVFFEIMTGDIPYRQEPSESRIILAIVRGKLPATLPLLGQIRDEQWGEAIEMNVTTKVLQRCWHSAPESRPSATWCAESLRYRSTNLLATYCDKVKDIGKIPAEYRTDGEGWTIIHNPDSDRNYDAELSRPIVLGGLLESVIGFTPDGQKIVTRYGDSIILYDTHSLERESTFRPHKSDNMQYGSGNRYYTFKDADVIVDAAIGYASPLVATIHNNFVIRIFDLTRGLVVRSYDCPRFEHFVEDGPYFAGSDEYFVMRRNHELFVWDLRMGTPTRRIDVEQTGSLRTSPGSSTAAWTGGLQSERLITFVNLQTGSTSPRYALDFEVCYYYSTLSLDGKLLYFVENKDDSCMRVVKVPPFAEIAESQLSGASSGRAPLILESQCIKGPEIYGRLSMSSKGSLAGCRLRGHAHYGLWELGADPPTCFMAIMPVNLSEFWTLSPGSAPGEGIMAVVSGQFRGQGWEKILQILKYRIRP